MPRSRPGLERPRSRFACPPASTGSPETRRSFFPNARRCFAYFTDSSSAPCARPTASAAIPMRPPSSALSAIFKPLSLFAQPVFDRHFAVVQQNFDRSAKLCCPILSSCRPTLESFEARLDQKRRNAFAAGFRIGLRKDEEDSGYAAVRDPRLCAVQTINSAISSAALKPSRLPATRVRSGGAHLNPRRVRAGLAVRSDRTRREFLPSPGVANIFSSGHRCRSSRAALAPRNSSRRAKSPSPHPRAPLPPA